MKLEPIIQSEGSKSERKTPIQYINAYIWIQKDGNDNPVCETAKETFGLYGRRQGWDDLREEH